MALVMVGASTAAVLRAQTSDIVDTAVAAGSFKTLAKALQAADLVGTLKGDGPFTVFAPTDVAFARMPAAELHTLLEDTAALRRMLALHIVPDRVRPPHVGRPTSAITIDGQTLNLTHENGEYRVEDVRIVKTNIPASNGVIHAINGVLLPR